MKKFLTLISLTLLLSACGINIPTNNNQPVTNQNLNENENIDEPINVGGGCQYKSIAGEAKILSIESAPASGNSCPIEPQLVKFVFTADDSTAKDIIAELHINAGVTPSLKWIKDNDVTVGKTYSVERHEITNGTCSPVVYKFLELNVFPTTGCN